MREQTKAQFAHENTISGGNEHAVTTIEMTQTSAARKYTYAKPIVVMAGDVGVGKTSLVMRLTRGHFFDHQASTCGASFFAHDGVDVWDTAGQERYACVAPIYYRTASVVVIVVDVQASVSWTRAQSIHEDVVACNRRCAVVMVANKCDRGEEFSDDKRDSSVDLIRIMRWYAQEHDLLFFCASARTGYNVSNAFERIVACARAVSQDGEHDAVERSDVTSGARANTRYAGGGSLSVVLASCGQGRRDGTSPRESSCDSCV